VEGLKKRFNISTWSFRKKIKKKWEEIISEEMMTKNYRTTGNIILRSRKPNKS
jgi:hypothetical protein